MGEKKAKRQEKEEKAKKCRKVGARVGVESREGHESEQQGERMGTSRGRRGQVILLFMKRGMNYGSY